MPTALIKFTQGAHTDLAGRAVKGDLVSGTVVVSNGDNTGVVSWEYEILYVPPGSSVPLTHQGPGVLSTLTFGPPDVPGSYRVKLTVRDGSGNADVDIRVFSVPLPNTGILIPPYQGDPAPLPLTGTGSKPNEMNFGGQANGWDGTNNSSFVLLDQVLGMVDQLAPPLSSAGKLPISNGTGFDYFVGTAGGQVVKWNGTQWVAGAVDLTDSDAVSGRLPLANVARGGTNQVLWSQDSSHDPIYTGDPVISGSLTIGNSGTPNAGAIRLPNAAAIVALGVAIVANIPLLSLDANNIINIGGNTSTDIGHTAFVRVNSVSMTFSAAASAGSNILSIENSSTPGTTGKTIRFLGQTMTGPGSIGGDTVIGGAFGAGGSGSVRIVMNEPGDGSGTTRLLVKPNGQFQASFYSTGLAHFDTLGNITSSSVLGTDLANNTITGVQLARGGTSQVLWSQDGSHDPAFTGSPSLSTSLAIGTNPAQTGVLRLPYDQAIFARNSDNTGDLPIIRRGTVSINNGGFTETNAVVIGDSTGDGDVVVDGINAATGFFILKKGGMLFDSTVKGAIRGAGFAVTLSSFATTINNATGTAIRLLGQIATGSSSTGGDAVVASGHGTLADGSVLLVTGDPGNNTGVGNVRLTVKPTGVVQFNAYTTAGVAHFDTLGNITSSAVVGSDLANNTVTTTQLARGGTNQVLWSQDSSHNVAFTGSPVLSTGMDIGTISASPSPDALQLVRAATTDRVNIVLASSTASWRFGMSTSGTNEIRIWRSVSGFDETADTRYSFGSAGLGVYPSGISSTGFGIFPGGSSINLQALNTVVGVGLPIRVIGQTSTGTTGGDILLDSGTGAAGATGSVRIRLGTSSPVEIWNFQKNLLFATQAALYAMGVTPSATNWTLSSDGQFTTLNGSITANLALGGNPIFSAVTSATGSPFGYGLDGVAFPVGSSFALYQQTRLTNDPTHDLLIQSQAPFSGSTGTNRNPGNLLFSIPAPVSGGTAGTHTFSISASQAFRIDSSGVAVGPSAAATGALRLPGNSNITWKDGDGGDYVGVRLVTQPGGSQLSLGDATRMTTYLSSLLIYNTLGIVAYGKEIRNSTLFGSFPVFGVEADTVATGTGIAIALVGQQLTQAGTTGGNAVVSSGKGAAGDGSVLIQTGYDWNGAAAGTTRAQFRADGFVLFPFYSTGIAHFDSTGKFTSAAVNLASSDVTGVLPIGNIPTTGGGPTVVGSGRTLMGTGSIHIQGDNAAHTLASDLVISVTQASTLNHGVIQLGGDLLGSDTSQIVAQITGVSGTVDVIAEVVVFVDSTASPFFSQLQSTAGPGRLFQMQAQQGALGSIGGVYQIGGGLGGTPGTNLSGDTYLDVGRPVSSLTAAVRVRSLSNDLFSIAQQISGVTVFDSSGNTFNIKKHTRFDGVISYNENASGGGPNSGQYYFLGQPTAGVDKVYFGLGGNPVVSSIPRYWAHFNQGTVTQVSNGLNVSTLATIFVAAPTYDLSGGTAVVNGVVATVRIDGAPQQTNGSFSGPVYALDVAGGITHLAGALVIDSYAVSIGPIGSAAVFIDSIGQVFIGTGSSQVEINAGGGLRFDNIAASMFATGGLASGPPSNPAGYATISVNGIDRKFIYYN